MPGVDYLGGFAVDEPALFGSLKIGALKTHKALPRVETQQSNLTDKSRKGRGSKHAPASQPRDRRHDDEGGLSRTWLKDSPDFDMSPATSQALTPPIDFRDNFKSWIDDKALRDREFLSQQKIDPGNSPLVVDIPPIPDNSPVRYPPKYMKLEPFAYAQDVSGGSARTITESRTDSFETARENISSDDESFPLVSPSLHPARQKWLREAGVLHSGDVGLGLELKSEDEESSTPKESARRKKPEVLRGDFRRFDGTWESRTSQDLEDAESEVTARRSSDDRVKESESDDSERAKSDSPTLGFEAKRSLKKEPRKQRRQEKRTRSPSMKVKTGMHRRNPSMTQSQEDARPEDYLGEAFQDMQDIQQKRLSQASTSSTVVEAMVIESSPPCRRPSLRHTGKLLMLDAPHDRPKHTDYTSTQPDGTLAKHPLRSSKNGDHGLRESFASQSTSSRTSKPTLTYPERSNVVVIPDRRSSLQSSVNSSKRLSRTFSLNSKPQSSRPTTAPENAVGYFDSPQRGRTLSVVIQQATPAKNTERGVSPRTKSDGSLAVAAATKDLARTTSVTSHGMTTHQVSPTNQGASTLQIADASENQVIKADRSNSGDWTALRPTSALVTPYSIRSHSSTPGTLEVNEATAISIYPHTNSSILVISKFADGDSSSPREQSALIAGNASIGLPSTFSSLAPQTLRKSEDKEVPDSSLQNPRAPPSPPGLKVIPPTPANAASSSEDTVRHVHSSKGSSRFSAPFASLRRAMSARRYSESSIANPFIFTRTLSLRDTAHNRRPHSREESRDSQLHPFWRPRTYWDRNDDSDSDSEFGNHGVLPLQNSKSVRTIRSMKKPDMVVHNPKRTMSLTRRFADSLRSEPRYRPSPRRATTSPSSEVVSGRPYQQPQSEGYDQSNPKRTQFLTRRIGGSLRLPSASVSRHQRPRRSTTAYWNNQPNYEFVPADQRHCIVDDMSHQPRSVGLHHLAERIERRRSLREESKREERRQVLKGRIKPVGVRDSELHDGLGMVHASSPSRRPRPATEAWMDGPDIYS